MSKLIVLPFWLLLFSVVIVVFTYPYLWQWFIVPNASFMHPDHNRTTCQIVQSRGFQCEIHPVATYQGYLVELHRIVPFAFGAKYGRRSRPVILQCGLTSTSTNFVLTSETVPMAEHQWSPNLAFELAKRGYDVWLSNNRGNRYGLRHLHYQIDDEKFWDFSFDEMSQYDIPAFIDYVRSITGKPKVAYVGHSQGTAMMFALLASNRSNVDWSQIVEPFVAISPITRIGEGIASLRYFVSFLNWLPINRNRPIFYQMELIRQIKMVLCTSERWNFICQWIFKQACGSNTAQTNMTRVPVYSAQLPSSTSMRNLIHFHQMFSTDRFASFNHSGNATDYQLTNIEHPAMHMIYTDNDDFTNAESIRKLKNDLPGAKEFYQIQYKNATHCDPLFGIDVAVEVSQKVVSILSHYHK